MSSARRSDPQRSAPQDKKNVSCLIAGRRFCLFVFYRGGAERENTGQTGRRRRSGQGRFAPECRAGAAGRQRAAGGGNERRTLGKRNERQATERQTAGRQGRQGRQSHQGPKKPSDEKPSPGERPPQQPHKARHGADGPHRPVHPSARQPAATSGSPKT